MAKKKKESVKEQISNQSNSKICAILSYLFIGLIWYAVDENIKKSEFAKYHVKQGLVLLIASIAYDIILGIIFSILLFPTLISGLFVGLFALIQLLYYVPLIFTIIGIINAINDKQKELPVIGHFATKLTF